MDASASPTVDSNLNELYQYWLKIEKSNFSPPAKQNKTTIKYTKLPDYNQDPKVQWPKKSSQWQPRLRRLTTIGDSAVATSRSLKSDLIKSKTIIPHKTMNSNITKRKIVTIEEDNENDYHPKFSKEARKPGNTKTSSRAVEAEFKNERQYSQRSTSRLSSTLKLSKDAKSSARNVNTAPNRKDTTPKVNYKSRYSNVSQPSTDISKSRSIKDKESNRSKSNVSKVSLSKKLSIPKETDNEIAMMKSKVKENTKSINNSPFKKNFEKTYTPKGANVSPKRNTIFLKELSKNKPLNIIHVPLDKEYSKVIEDIESQISLHKKVDCSTEIDKDFYSKDVTIGTDSRFKLQNKMTQIEDDNSTLCRCAKNTTLQTELVKTTFDSLDIPNVTLKKDKNESKEEIVNFHSKSLPNLPSPLFNGDLNKIEEKDANFCHSTSYIISHATVTCTTRQKINVHVSNVVGNNNEAISTQSPSPLLYPMNVVSIFEKEMKKKQQDNNLSKQDNKSNVAFTNCINELQTLDCSYVLNSNKLVKPSELISTIRVNNGLLQSDYMCEQFQRELNFIDSFFESLQYLESCSLSNKCFTQNNVNSLLNSNIDVRNSDYDYDSFLSKLDNEATNENTETMASKSLCLLNLLIRDEQRRAKNLLFVLKMREDALKDFTKSQILWLENKKKQDNTDISTLKKKQRGALLKLQHECGEMQRMRKALLTQSEKRKVALMKTKKNIELTLTKNVSVDQIILGKKKLKRNSSDRNTAPLKCFELSSSGCDDSSQFKPKCDLVLPSSSVQMSSVTSAEKCIQTGDSILGTVQITHSPDTAAENCIVVDGGYLNILFHNISLPQIFSSGKQYEVNEEALKNIVNSANSHNKETEDVEKFVNQIKDLDLDSSTPSTARSLVEELDQFYKGLVEEDKSLVDSPSKESYLVYDNDSVQYESQDFPCDETMSNNTEAIVDILDPFMSPASCLCEVAGDVNLMADKESVSSDALTGPLMVPPVSATSLEPQEMDEPLWSYGKSSSSISEVTSVSSVIINQSETDLLSNTAIASPAQCEAEELRRQQLAIEREIKALEQQQSQLMVVREIPDKPPPPYTPKADAPRLPRMYVADETTEEKIQKYITDPHTESCDPTDPFDTFVKDFCIETMDRQKLERSEKPWDACNLLPQKSQDDTEKIIKNASTQLLDILAGLVPVVTSGVGGRRSDHIDDILFAEWRRCEPEWTSLHAEEASVKNQVFENIFQKILSETIEEYKLTVLCDD